LADPISGEALEDEARNNLAAHTVEIDDAAAESVGADVLLSTDERPIKRAARGLGAPRIQVRNPVSWG
jgi:hypothetical protein